MTPASEKTRRKGLTIAAAMVEKKTFDTMRVYAEGNTVCDSLHGTWPTISPAFYRVHTVWYVVVVPWCNAVEVQRFVHLARHTRTK